MRLSGFGVSFVWMNMFRFVIITVTTVALGVTFLCSAELAVAAMGGAVVG
jgi:hypothetical protein